MPTVTSKVSSMVGDEGIKAGDRLAVDLRAELDELTGFGGEAVWRVEPEGVRVAADRLDRADRRCRVHTSDPIGRHKRVPVGVGAARIANRRETRRCRRRRGLSRARGRPNRFDDRRNSVDAEG